MSAQQCTGIAVFLVLSLAPASWTMAGQNQRRVTSEEERGVPGTRGYRRETTRDERGDTVVERTVVEEPSIQGGAATTLRVEAEEVTTHLTAETHLRTRTEFTTDLNGRQSVTGAAEERVTERPDGGRSVVRSFSEPDANGVSRATRFETEETVAETGGVFRTVREIAVPDVDGTMSPVERVEQIEQRDGDNLLSLDETTYYDPMGTGTWAAQQRRVVNNRYDGGAVRGVEEVYAANDRGELILNDRVVSREWTSAGGREHRTEQIFTRDVTGQARAREPQFFQEVEQVRTPRAQGGYSSTRSVTEMRSGHARLVERVTETARPDGRGGMIIAREIQRAGLNGLETVSVTTTRESEGQP